MSTKVFKVFDFTENKKQMPQKIYFGNVEIINTKTRQQKIIEGIVFTEYESLTDYRLRSQVLREFKPQERERWKIKKLCFDTARYMSNTAY